MNNPFFVDPAYGRRQGGLAGLGDVLADNRAKREAQQASMAAQEQVNAALQSRDPDKIREASIANPQFAQIIQQQMGIEDEQQKQDMAGFGREFLTASPERKGEIYERRIQTIQARGGDASDTIQSYEDFIRDPEGETKDIELLYAGVDPKGYEALKSEAATGMKAQELDIKREGLNLRKQEAALRSDEQRLNRETNELKREELSQKIEKRKSDLQAGKQEVQDAGFAALDSVEKSSETIDRLLTHPGLESAVGTSSILPTLPGSDAADFEAELESFDAQSFLTAVKQMKGMGSLSESEGKKLSGAIGAINLGMSEKAFKRSLGVIKEGFDKAKRKLESQGFKRESSGPAEAVSIEDLVNKYAN